MIISKQMAVILGGFALAALLGITPYSCEPQKAAVARDYALLNQQPADAAADAALRHPC